MLIELLITGIYKYRIKQNGNYCLYVIDYQYSAKTKKIILSINSKIIDPNLGEITIEIPWSDTEFYKTKSVISITQSDLNKIPINTKHPFMLLKEDSYQYGLDDTDFLLSHENLHINESGIIKLEQHENLKEQLTALNLIRILYSNNLPKVKKLIMQIIHNHNQFFSCFLPTPELDRRTGTFRGYGLPPAFYYFKINDKLIDQHLAKELTSAMYYTCENIYNKICNTVDFRKLFSPPTGGIVGSASSIGRTNSLEYFIYDALTLIKEDEPVEKLDPIAKIIPEHMPDTYEQVQRLLEIIIVPYKMKNVAMRQSKSLKSELIDKIKLFFSRVNNIEHINKLYDYINEPSIKEIINVHRHSTLDAFLFWKEQTESWQDLIKDIREHFTMQIIRDAENEGNTVDDRISLYQKCLQFSSINQHRSNNPFARVFDTHTVKYIKEEINKLEKRLPQLKV